MRNWLITLICFILNSCQGNIHSSLDKHLIEEEFTKIEFASPQSKYVTECYMELERLFSATPQAKEYILHINIQYNNTPLLISKNSDLIRESVIAQVTYELSPIQKNKPSHTGKLTLRSVHNVLDAPYATHVDIEHINLKLAAQAAEEIHKRLFIYFHHNLNTNHS